MVRGRVRPRPAEGPRFGATLRPGRLPSSGLDGFLAVGRASLADGFGCDVSPELRQLSTDLQTLVFVDVEAVDVVQAHPLALRQADVLRDCRS